VEDMTATNKLSPEHEIKRFFMKFYWKQWQAAIDKFTVRASNRILPGSFIWRTRTPASAACRALSMALKTNHNSYLL